MSCSILPAGLPPFHPSDLEVMCWQFYQHKRISLDSVTAALLGDAAACAGEGLLLPDKSVLAEVPSLCSDLPSGSYRRCWEHGVMPG